jgi:uncharacterized protein DUF4339
MNAAMNAITNQWYVSRDGKQHGPFSDADLAKFSRLGQLQANDLLWREGLPDWRPATTIFPKPERAPSQVRPRANEPMRAKVKEPRHREAAPRTSGGLTWTIALIALVCSALIGATSGYVFKHFLKNTQFTQRPDQQ